MNENRFALDACIEACLDCSEACLLTAAWCLESGSNSVTKTHVTQLQLCAETCQLTAKAMILESASYRDFKDLCARIADHCADSCDSSTEGELGTCAAACRETALILRATPPAELHPLPKGVTRISSHLRI